MMAEFLDLAGARCAEDDVRMTKGTKIMTLKERLTPIYELGMQCGFSQEGLALFRSGRMSEDQLAELMNGSDREKLAALEIMVLREIIVSASDAIEAGSDRWLFFRG